MVVSVAVLCLFLLSGLATYRFNLAGTYWVDEDALRRNLWIVWGLKILGKTPGHILCGFILGSFLQRTTSWRVLLSITGFVFLGSCVPYLTTPSIGNYVNLIGKLGTLLQHAGTVLTSAGFIFLGIVMGEMLRARYRKD